MMKNMGDACLPKGLGLEKYVNVNVHVFNKQVCVDKYCKYLVLRPILLILCGFWHCCISVLMVFVWGGVVFIKIINYEKVVFKFGGNV
jgi:hypothetical protein